VNLQKHKFKLASILATREELKGVLSLSVLEPPEGSFYRIGDIIHTAPCGSARRDFKVYGIKAGGYGFAYIVLEETTLKPYCLKTFRDNSPEGTKEEEEFKREAETWIKVGKHPNLAYVDSVFMIGGRPHILFEYASGSDLRSQIKRGPIPNLIALRYAVQFCRGMTYAQSKLKGFVHGDIKPNNCLIAQDHTLKVTDFGQVDFDESLEATQSFIFNSQTDSLCPQTDSFQDTSVINWRAGTPAYMAPEQFDSANKTDARSDIYAFGVMLFEMLTGVRPFRGRKHRECFPQHLTAIPPDPRSLNPQIPRCLSELVLRCLEKTPDRRPAAFRLLESELSSMLWDFHQDKVPKVEPEELTEAESINRGASLMSLGQHDQALLIFASVLAVNPQLVPAWNGKGEAHLGLGQHDRAWRCFERAIELDSKFASAWANKGKTLTLMGQHYRAIPCFKRALKLDKESASVWHSQGQALLKLGHCNESMKNFRRALILDPKNFEALNDLGMLLDSLGRTDEAIDAFRRARQLNPRFIEAHCNLGELYCRRGNLHQAIEAYRQTLSVDPEHPRARAGLSGAARELCFSGIPSLTTMDAKLLTDFLFSDHKDSEAVIATASEYLRRSNFDPRVFYLCARKVCKALERSSPTRKRMIAEMLLEVRKNVYFVDQNRATFYWLGRFYYELDLYAECLAVFQRSITLFGPDDKALYFIAACNEIQGKYKVALDYYRKTLLLDPGCLLSAAGIKRIERHAPKLSRQKRQQKLKNVLQTVCPINLNFARGNS
jgi:serine/threonine protein kinase